MSRSADLGWAWKAEKPAYQVKPNVKRKKAGRSRNAKLWAEPLLTPWQREHMRSIKEG